MITVLLAVGGGSTMDSAKGIAAIGESNYTVKEVEDLFRTVNPIYPLPWKTYPIIAVPTTCGTGFSWNGAFPCQVHGCNHPITEILHISHGDSCAILLPWFVEWNGENAKEKFWEVHNAMYPLEAVKFKDFRIDDFVKKLMKLNYDINILDNLTMDEWVKKYGTAEKCGDEEIQAIIDAQFGAFGKDGGIPTFPRKTSVEQMTQALKDVNRGRYIYKPDCC